jgi:hypothetical protein
MELMLAVTVMKTTVFWDVTACSLLDRSLENLMVTYLTTQYHDASASDLQNNFPEYQNTQSYVPLQSCDFDRSESLLIKHYIFLPVVVYFSASAAQHGLWLPRPRGFLITHNDAPQSV